MLCPACAAPLDGDEKFCPHCGAALPETEKGHHLVPILILVGLSLLGLVFFYFTTV